MFSESSEIRRNPPSPPRSTSGSSLALRALLSELNLTKPNPFFLPVTGSKEYIKFSALHDIASNSVLEIFVGRLDTNRENDLCQRAKILAGRLIVPSAEV